MNIKEVKELSSRERYLYWVTERESIRLKRKRGLPRPWTDDAILQNYKFCNVRRMDDRVSQWLYNNWYKPYKDHPNMLTAVTLARQLNNTDSLAEVGFPEVWNPTVVEKILNERVKQGKKNFSAAYMITGTLGGTKVEQIVHKVVTPIHVACSKTSKLANTNSMIETWRNLLPFAGFSSFISGQVVADLRWGLTGGWYDRKFWAPMGPGSKRGMNRLLGRPFVTPVKQEEFYEFLEQQIQFCKSELEHSISSRMEAIDVQNTLCEFDKYERTLWEGRRPKQRYKGTGA